jgi:hypothetical protein
VREIELGRRADDSNAPMAARGEASDRFLPGAHEVEWSGPWGRTEIRPLI